MIPGGVVGVTVFLHEVHQVVGTAEDEFESAFRDAGGWMDRLAGGRDGRLLWFNAQNAPPFRWTYRPKSWAS